MWALFTMALSRASSTTRVSIINTSANFVITAVLGFLVFAETLPPLWWLGAALLVAGNVIIGRRVDSATPAPSTHQLQDELERGTGSSGSATSDSRRSTGTLIDVTDALASPEQELDSDHELKDEDIDDPLKS